MWYEEDFVKLANLLYKKKIFDYIYLICGPDKSYMAKKIIDLSNKKYFIDCSQKDLGGIIYAIKNSDIYIGNNSGPLNLSAALNVKTFGLIANDPISELKYSKITTITPIDFYPKDDTPGCTIETNDFNKLLPKFKKLNCDVFGISKDTLKSHDKFRDKYKIKFDLLSDEDLTVLKKYKVWAKKKFMGREFMGILRTTFLIDPKGKIIKIWENVKVKDHAKDVLDTLNSIQK